MKKVVIFFVKIRKIVPMFPQINFKVFTRVEYRVSPLMK